jgi:hypothetical protein
VRQHSRQPRKDRVRRLFASIVAVEASLGGTMREAVIARNPCVDLIAADLAELLALRDCWFEPFPFEAQLPRIEPGRILLPASEPGLTPWRTDTAIELPVRLDGLTLGRFVLAPAKPTVGVSLSPDGRAIAIDLANSVAPVVAKALRHPGATIG